MKSIGIFKNCNFIVFAAESTKILDFIRILSNWSISDGLDFL